MGARSVHTRTVPALGVGFARALGALGGSSPVAALVLAILHEAAVALLVLLHNPVAAELGLPLDKTVFLRK